MRDRHPHVLIPSATMVLVALLLSTMACGPAAAATLARWHPPTLLWNTTGLGVIAGTSVVVDDGGNATASWIIGSSLMASRMNASGSWSAAIQVNDVPGAVRAPYSLLPGSNGT